MRHRLILGDDPVVRWGEWGSYGVPLRWTRTNGGLTLQERLTRVGYNERDVIVERETRWLDVPTVHLEDDE